MLPVDVNEAFAIKSRQRMSKLLPKMKRLHCKKIIDEKQKLKKCLLALIKLYKTEANRFFYAYVADISCIFTFLNKMIVNISKGSYRSWKKIVKVWMMME